MIEPRPSQSRIRPTDSELPNYPQPWEAASVVFGVPGAFVSAVLLMPLVMAGDTLFAVTAMVALGAVYFGTMGVLWIGVAHERRG